MISARCGFSSTPRPTSSSRSTATTASACGTSAKTRPRRGEALDLAVDAARIEQRDDPDQSDAPSRCAGGRQRGRSRAPGRAGPARHRDREISGMGSGARHRAAGVDHGARGRRAARRSAPRRGSARSRRCFAQPDSAAGPRRAGRPNDPAETTARWPRSRCRRHARSRDRVADASGARSAHFPHHHLEASRSRGRCCCSTFRNRPATAWHPAPRFSTSSVWRSRFSPKP